jgi:hypothetical protein
VLQELHYDQKQSHPLASHYDREEMQQHVVMKFPRAFHLSFQQLSYALQLRDMDGLPPLVSDLCLQGDAYCFHQILMKDPF